MYTKASRRDGMKARHFSGGNAGFRKIQSRQGRLKICS